MKRFLFIDNHNFRDFPVGGTLSFARQMMRVFGERLALVGVSDIREKVGRWTRFEDEGQSFDFFPYRCLPRTEKKGLLPQKVKDYAALRRHMGRIRAPGWRDVFVQIQNGMLAVAPYTWKSVCFRFPGVSNIAAFSKYPWVRPLAGVYERRLFRALDRASVILATANREAISGLVTRSRGTLSPDRVRFFPTRIDTTPFERVDRDTARTELGLDADARVALFCGRISWPKGWDLVLAGFAEAARTEPGAMLLVVGDGEDAPAMKAKATELGIAGRVRMAGRQPPGNLPRYYAACDAVVIGSHVEGWSNTMLEALAAARPMVSTSVSGAAEMIREGVNGFVLSERDPRRFGQKLGEAWRLEDVGAVSHKLVQPYRFDTLRADLEALWPAIREE